MLPQLEHGGATPAIGARLPEERRMLLAGDLDVFVVATRGVISRELKRRRKDSSLENHAARAEPQRAPERAGEHEADDDANLSRPVCDGPER